jgi:23S rRNA (adenine2503-C2)-methyltransferase
MEKIDIKTLTRSQLAGWLAERGIATFRATQIFHWVFNRQTDDFSVMTNLKKDIRALLADHFTVDRLNRRAVETAEDGTRKFLFELADGQLIETVLIQERTHATLCISSQVGCAQGCRFCLTARAGFTRNLTAGEILAQVRDVSATLATPQQLTNVVLMGMGEPLANYDSVMAALDTLTCPEAGLGISAKKVTLSTVGLAPKLAGMGRQTRINIAISLNAPDNELRSWLMPINRRYPLEALLAACRVYPLEKRRLITFEYILIKDLNDSPAQAKKIGALLRPVKAKINLIPFNPHGGCDFQRPSDETVREFQKVLLDMRYTTSIRLSKGADISAACGQLRAKALLKSRTA